MKTHARFVLVAVFISTLLIASARAAEDLIPQGAVWSYRKGFSPPPQGWNGPGFDAAAWLTGPAGIGYGDGDDATTLTDMQDGYLTVYARRTFTVADPASIATLVLRISYDDGFIAYLNGVEVLRSFMGAAGSPAAFDTPASDLHEAAGFEPFDLSARKSLLVAGANVLAFEVHNQALTSSDLSFHPQLVANGSVPSGPLPPGFALETIASGFRSPVGVAFTPDGRMLVVEKRGVVWVVKDGIVLSTPFLTLEDEINNAGDRGLLGLDLDPDFAQNGYFYVLYVVDPVSGAPDEPGDAITFGRLVRYTAQGDSADTASRLILLGHSAADGFVHCHSSHSIGTVKAAPDGSLFVGSGDGGHFDFTDGGQDVTSFDPGCASTFGAAQDRGALRSQGLDILAGKILRIDSATGGGLPDNPFFTGNASDARSRVWVSGLRNPYRFTVRPDSGVEGTLFIGDVGWNTWEELNVAHGGENFGWPCYEGMSAQGSYQSDGLTSAYCQGLGSATVTRPLITWNHGSAGTLGFIGNCAAGVAFYTGTSYPRSYTGACFFADYGQNWIRVAHVDAIDRLLSIEDFGTGLERPVDIETEPATGDLVYVSIQAGDVRRIRYTVGNRPPTVLMSATPTAGDAPLEVQFGSDGTFDPDLDPVALDWDFGDGSPHSTAAGPIHVYAQRGTFTATLTASDDRGGSASRSTTIETTNSPPQVSIDNPADGTRFFGGERFALRATAIDVEDGANLTIEWVVQLHHEDHVHPEWFVSTEREPVFVAESHGDSGESFYYEIQATVTDSGGLSASASASLVPGEVLRGDGNADGVIDISDAVNALLHVFAGQTAACALALDADASGDVGLTDAIVILRYLFQDGPQPAAPFPDCGVAKNIAAIPCGVGCP